MQFNPDKKILIVDDDDLMRNRLREYLKKLKFTKFVEADDGSDGLDLIKDNDQINDPIQLVISDWNMPVMDGIDLLRGIRNEPRIRKVPFLLMTVAGSWEKMVEVASLEAAFIEKPFEIDELKKKLDEIKPGLGVPLS